MTAEDDASAASPASAPPTENANSAGIAASVSGKPPRDARRLALRCVNNGMLLLAAVGIPFLATAVTYLALRPAGRLSTISVGFITGLVVGQLIGIRRRRLASFLFGPALGMLIGYLDLQAFIWLYVEAEIPLAVVSVLPIWGLGFGAWVALYYQRWRSRFAVVAVVASVNFLSQLVWMWWAADALQKMGESIRYVEPVVLVAPIVAVVFFTPVRQIK